jgi:hypothetical protein
MWEFFQWMVAVQPNAGAPLPVALVRCHSISHGEQQTTGRVSDFRLHCDETAI